MANGFSYHSLSFVKFISSSYILKKSNCEKQTYASLLTKLPLRRKPVCYWIPLLSHCLHRFPVRKGGGEGGDAAHLHFHGGAPLSRHGKKQLRFLSRICKKREREVELYTSASAIQATPDNYARQCVEEVNYLERNCLIIVK